MILERRSFYGLSQFRIVIFIFVICSSSLLVSGCDRRAGYDEYREFQEVGIEKDERAARIKFSGYSIEKQIDIYVFSKCCVEGPVFYFEEFFDYKNSELLSTVTNRISECNDYQMKYILIYLIRETFERNENIPNNEEIVEILEKHNEAPEKGDSDIVRSYKQLYSNVLRRIKEISSE